MDIGLLLLRSLQTAWDFFRPTRVVEFGGVAVLPGTNLRGHPCRKTGNGGNVLCQFEFDGEVLAGLQCIELTSTNRLCGQRR